MENGINIKGFSAEELAEFARFLEEEGLAAPETGAIPRRAQADVYQLSFAQERLWFLDQFVPNNLAYNLQVPLLLQGPLDVAALEQSLTTIVERHEVLRTVFATRDNLPVQVILPAAAMPLDVVDLRGSAGAQEQQAQQLAEAELLQPFDLARGPLFRAILIQLDEQKHALLLTLHHIAFDGWSAGLLSQELIACYAAYSAGQAPALDPLPIQYADYALWQRQWLQGQQMAESLAYWRRQLAGAPDLLELPTDRPRPLTQTYHGALLPVLGSRQATATLAALCQQEGVTLFMGLLALFQVLLARYSGQEDVVVGTPIANRTQAQTENLIGFFVNTLALRGDLSDNPTFRQVLARLREVTLDAYAHQDVPFEQIVDALKLERNISHSPLFQVMFALQNAPEGPPAFPGLALLPFDIKNTLAKFDLQLDLWEAEGGLQGEFLYNTDLFDTATIERMSTHFIRLLETLAAQPDLPVMQVPLTTAQEQRQLLEAAHGSRPAAPTRPLHVQFEAQVERAPNAVALVYPSSSSGHSDGERLTYQELNGRANRLAHHLRSLGVGPEVLVGLYLERSSDMLVGLLAILKAGGAYLPIDPAYPADRIAFMLDDAQVSVLLTTQEQRTKPVLSEVEGNKEQSTDSTTERKGVLHTPPADDERAYGTTPPADDGQPTVVNLDADWPTIAQQPATNPDSGVTSDNLAYVIYTSGSTGKPKGALITHAHVSRLFSATQHWFEFDEQDVWTLFHSTAFDFSVWEIWGALLYGGRLVVVPYLVSRSPEAFAALLEAEQVTVLNQTPSAFRQVSGAILAAAPAQLALRYIIFGGEALDLQSLRPWFDRYGDQHPRLINMYGITETTVHVTYRPINAADLETATGSVIGVPIPDLHVYVLDRYQQPVPIGVAGEMYVGGAGVARGYLNRPELTEQRFVACPWSVVSGQLQPTTDNGQRTTDNRLYRTGDLARLLATGDLQYLGRADQQVKIRGFRIELGEIETALEQHPALSEVVVMPHTDDAGHTRLVAYVVPDQEQRTTQRVPDQEQKSETPDSQFSILNSQFSIQELRDFLLRTLPDYMVPSVFLVLDKLPLTPSGKLDRRALPAPSGVRPQLAEAYAAPRTAIEALLAQIWAEALKLVQVGIHDNFFALGGDSLVSVQVLALARSRGIQFLLQDLFRHQTVAALAPHATPHAEDIVAPAHAAPFSMVAEVDRVRLPADIEDAYPLTMLQSGMLYHMMLDPEAPDYHNVDSFHYRGAFDIDKLRQSLAHMVVRHPILRTSFELSQYSEPLQLVHTSAAFDVEEEDLRHLSRQEQEQVIAAYVAQEKKHIFDLSRPPLLRFRAHRRTNESFQFTLTECHAILDGWSLGALSSEIFICHNTLLDHGAMPELPPLTSSFRDFVLQERQALQSEAHRHFWAARLEGAALTRLPRWPERYRRQNDQPVRETRAISIDPALLQQLRELTRSEGVSLKTVFLAAHLRVLNLLSGQTDLMTGMSSHGRLEEEGGERVCGLFLNPLPFRMQLPGGTWRDLLRSTFAAECELLPYRAYPQGAIQQQWSGGERLFEALFNYTHFRPIADEIGLSRLEVLEETATSEPINIPLLASFYVDPETSNVTLFIQHHPDILSPEQAQAIHAYYPAALRALVRDPSARYETVDLLSNGERQQLLATYNATATEYPRERAIHELFVEQAELRPDATAAVFGDERLTYGVLHRRSDRLAARLLASGVQPGALVGIYAERSADLIIGVLGILKAGCAYVPLDPSHPAERLAYMLEDARAGALVCQPHLADAIPSFTGAVITFEREQDDDQPLSFQAPAVPADQLAYVMYTSGSTGRPKGIGIPHRAITRLVCNTNYIAFTPDDRVAQASNSSFDAATFEIWGALAHGARLIGVPQDTLLNPQQFAAHIRATGINVLFVTTALFNQLARETPDIFATMREVLFGGEAVDPRWVEQVLRHAPPSRLLHVYGPTESTTFATWHEIRDLAPGATTVPIGRPLANTQAYVLDRHGMLVPPGVPGELYLGGDGLAHGYLGRPELTAEKFVPSPWSVVSGQLSGTTDNGQRTTDNRLYRTGDLVCLQPDGAIEFVGRLDQQVKLRGFRIELGEIETALAQHPDIQDAVVVADADTAGDKRLIAYLVADQPQSLDLQDIQRFVSERLPVYMVPAGFVPLEKLPLNANGKVDRRALPDPATAIAVHQAFIAPRTPTEVTLAGLWAEVLGVERVSAADDFFGLGGHSLALMRLSTQVRETFQAQVPLRDFFEASTLADMALMIAGHVQAPASQSIAPISRVYQDDDDAALLDQLSDADLDELLREAQLEDRGSE